MGARGAGAAAAAVHPSADARVLAVRYDEQGKRYRQFKDSLPLLVEHQWADWRLTGPRTAKWLYKYIDEFGGGTEHRTKRFMDDAGVAANDRVRHEHTFIMDFLKWAICYDQLDVSSLACSEIASRRVQLLEEAYSVNPKAPRFDGSHHFQGLGKRNLAVMPELASHVADSLKTEAAISKERRKAREEASLKSKA
jgi:hypothetical protein